MSKRAAKLSFYMQHTARSKLYFVNFERAPTFTFLARTLSALIISLGISTDILAQSAEASSPKKVIEFGWDMPNTFFVQQHVAEMERMPFDGLVLAARYTESPGVTKLLHQTAAGANKLNWAALEPAAFALAATKFSRFTDNFLRLNISPMRTDWFDSFAAITHNFALAGRIVRQGNIKGVFLDLEPYAQPIFRYTSLKRRGRKTFAQYQRQVRLRAQALMRALQAEAPNLTIFLPLGYDQAAGHPARSGRFGLLPSFLDGLFSAARGGTKIVDGFENAYGFTTEREFARAYGLMRRRITASAQIQTQYNRRISAAFGLWMDFDSNRHGWNTDDLSSNYFSPKLLTSTLAKALKQSDRYVWIYTQQPQWWTGERLPAEYIEALERTRVDAGLKNQ